MHSYIHTRAYTERGVIAGERERERECVCEREREREREINRKMDR